MKHKRLWAREWAPVSDFARGESFSISPNRNRVSKRHPHNYGKADAVASSNARSHKQQKYVNSMCRHVCVCVRRGVSGLACARALNDIPFYWQSFYFVRGGGRLVFTAHGERAEDVRERVCEMRAPARAKRFGASDTDRQKGWPSVAGGGAGEQ